METQLSISEKQDPISQMVAETADLGWVFDHAKCYMAVFGDGLFTIVPTKRPPANGVSGWWWVSRHDIKVGIIENHRPTANFCVASIIRRMAKMDDDALRSLVWIETDRTNIPTLRPCRCAQIQEDAV